MTTWLEDGHLRFPGPHASNHELEGDTYTLLLPGVGLIISEGKNSLSGDKLYKNKKQGMPVVQQKCML